MAEAQIVLSNEQKFTSKLLENLESSQKCVIWKREKYESILNKVKTGKKELPQDYYYMQRYVQVMFQNFMLLEWGIDFGLVTPPVSEQEAQRCQTWCSDIL